MEIAVALEAATEHCAAAGARHHGIGGRGERDLEARHGPGAGELGRGEGCGQLRGSDDDWAVTPLRITLQATTLGLHGLRKPHKRRTYDDVRTVRAWF